MPVIICLKVPGRNVFTSTLLMQTVCWKLLFEGSHEMIDEECVTADALTHEGPSGAPRPIIIVQAASFDVFLLTNTERTLIRCGCKKRNAYAQVPSISPSRCQPDKCSPLVIMPPPKTLDQSIQGPWPPQRLQNLPWSAPSFPEIDSLRWGHQHHDMGVNHGG